MRFHPEEILPLVKQTYPDALPSGLFMYNVIQGIFNGYDYTPSQVLLANSICSDDINSIEYPLEAREIPGPFNLGGLNGFPFTGLTGIAAFASHVPDDGSTLIFYGPHTGINSKGEAGKVTRLGQQNESTCCGTAELALKRLHSPRRIDPMDDQQIFLENLLKENKNRILTSKNPVTESAEIFYEAIDKRLNELIEKTVFNGEYIFMIGGITINSDLKHGSFIAPRRNDVLRASDKSVAGHLSLF